MIVWLKLVSWDKEWLALDWATRVAYGQEEEKDIVALYDHNDVSDLELSVLWPKWVTLSGPTMMV